MGVQWYTPHHYQNNMIIIYKVLVRVTTSEEQNQKYKPLSRIAVTVTIRTFTVISARSQEEYLSKYSFAFLRYCLSIINMASFLISQHKIVTTRTKRSSVYIKICYLKK